MEMSLQAWKEDETRPFPTSQSCKFTAVWLLFTCLFGWFEYLNMNSSTIPVISFNKNYLELFHSKSPFFKIDALQKSPFIKQMNLVSLRAFANHSGFPILFWHNSRSNVMKINAALSVSNREPYKCSSNRRCGDGLFLILLFWFNLVYCFFNSFF